MPDPNWTNRTIWTGDNLDIMRGMNSESVDLIYLDPPFNSNRNYAAPIGSKAAGASFKDTWTLSDLDVAWMGLIADTEPALYRVVETAGLAHGKHTQSYLCMMAVRLIEMKRVMKPTGSIYLHCDPTASHYLKILMDVIFGSKQFRNNIVWERLKGAGKRTQHKKVTFGRATDHLLFYTMSDDYLFEIDRDLVPYTSEYKKTFKYSDRKGPYGRRSPFNSPGQGARPNQCYEYKGFYPPHDAGWNKTLPSLKVMDADGDLEFVNGKVYRKQRPKPGKHPNNLWLDIPPVTGKEATKYPTQKPLDLLSRIIKISSNEGDTVLDPFCGCATACVAAERHGRQWVGIDLSEKALELVVGRMKRELGLFYDVNHRTDLLERTDTLQIKHSYKEMKHILFGEQEGVCNLCNFPFEYRILEVDHVIPKSKGGGWLYFHAASDTYKGVNFKA